MSKTSSPAVDRNSSLTSTSLRMSYRIARGEQGVLTFEPYKSALLPLWRFKTVSIAQKSSSELWDRFLDYDRAGDFVGMDMARKFIQMGFTRAKRYANHKGGRKYAVAESQGGGRGKSEVLAKSKGHEGKEEKEQVSLIFKEVWERCKRHEGYQEKKEAFLAEQKEWDKAEKSPLKVEKPKAAKKNHNVISKNKRKRSTTEDEGEDAG